MPTHVNGYRCDRCSAFYGESEDAVKCEADHPKVETMQITGARFDSVQNKYLWDRSFSQRYPATITIKFSEKHGDFARYVREQIGFQGV